MNCNNCRLAEATSKKFEDVNALYQGAGCCVRAAEDLRIWALSTFGAHLSVQDVHLVFKVGGTFSQAPVLYAQPGEGPPCPTSTLIDGEKRVFRLEPGTCVWRFETRKQMRSVQAYKHTVVQLGEVFLDWGFNQYLLPSGTEARMVVV